MADDDCTTHSRSSSADQALFEWLGVTELSLKQEQDDDHWTATTDAPGPSVQHYTPPNHCHRPNTPHSPLLIVCRDALSSQQCNYIIQRAYQASNNRNRQDGGAKRFGPQYVTEAAHSNYNNHNNNTDDTTASNNKNNNNNMRVQLVSPNHHKVCVFGDHTIGTWLSRIVDDLLGECIEEWQRASLDDSEQTTNNTSSSIVNPRLRLLRYDACDQDVFLPHYDATTTTTSKQHTDTMPYPSLYESKLTILCYLNDDFEGGQTVFLDRTQPRVHPLHIQPRTGTVVLFNHELYHASQPLQFCPDIYIKTTQRPTAADTTTNNGVATTATVEDVVIGGTKFVLRSDVMFETSIHTTTASTTTTTTACAQPPPPCVSDILRALNDDNVMERALPEEFLHLSVSTFCGPGREVLLAMLLDLGVKQKLCLEFLDACFVASVSVAA